MANFEQNKISVLPLHAQRIVLKKTLMYQIKMQLTVLPWRL